MSQKELSPEKSELSGTQEGSATSVRAWIKVGAVAAASALAGGLAAAWFYRKTLNKLREAESDVGDSKSAISDSQTEHDI